MNYLTKKEKINNIKRNNLLELINNNNNYFDKELEFDAKKTFNFFSDKNIPNEEE